jgi:hypothetical protein
MIILGIAVGVEIFLFVLECACAILFIIGVIIMRYPFWEEGKEIYNSLSQWMIKEPVFSLKVYRDYFNDDNKKYNAFEKIFKIVLKSVILLFLVLILNFFLILSITVLARAFK